MEKESSNLGTYIIIAIILIVLTVAYIFMPKSWENLGDNYKPRTVDKSGGPTPTSLQFKNPFKYDNNKAPKRVEPVKPTGNETPKPLFWKEKK
ncbi:hypothetical protein [Arcobacter sp.]|uniref:hypothetical protein n=1 Tax=Arcobacter sp. TaxID=1872629 RepID=UPI003D10B6A3